MLLGRLCQTDETIGDNGGDDNSVSYSYVGWAVVDTVTSIKLSNSNLQSKR